ncbi:MAG: cation diffusion facilitator family transporter [Chloroflexota bacterium]
MTASRNTNEQVQHVLVTTLVLNIIVAVSKIMLGWLTGALAIAADGVHSLTDGAGNVAGLVGNYYAGRPADENHPYGHKRFESLAALLIGALLLLTAWEMGQGVLDRLSANIPPQITSLTIGVLVVTLVINIAVATYQTRAGKRLKSQILLADAKNTQADVFVTLAVIISSVTVALTGWVWVDLVAALVVVVLIGRAAWEILQQTGLVLVDTAPYEADELNKMVMDVPADIVRARSRGTRDAPHIDIDVRVPPEMTTDQTHSIAYAIRQQVAAQVGEVQEVEVHFVPHHPYGRDAVLTARAYADARGLSTHEVQLLHDERGCVLEMHVEVSPELTLAEAHTLVSDLEADIVGALDHVDNVVTHIEPQHTTPEIENTAVRIREAQHLETKAHHLLVSTYPDADWHDLTVRPLPHGYALSLHTTLAPCMTVDAAHTVAENAETLLRSHIEPLQRVIIHTEPFDHD